MNALARRALTYVVPAVAGVGAGAAGTVALTSGAHEAIVVALGDTVTLRYSIKTDTVLKVAGPSQIVAAKCGTSNIYLRTWKGTQVQRSADTVDVTVPCAPPVDTLTPVASVSVCFLPPDTATKYGIRGDVSPTLEQLPHVLANCDTVGNLTLARSFRADPRQQRLGSVMFRRPDSIPTSTPPLSGFIPAR